MSLFVNHEEYFVLCKLVGACDFHAEQLEKYGNVLKKPCNAIKRDIIANEILWHSQRLRASIKEVTVTRDKIKAERGET